MSLAANMTIPPPPPPPPFLTQLNPTLAWYKHLPYSAVHVWLMTSKQTVPDLQQKEINKEKGSSPERLHHYDTPKRKDRTEPMPMTDISSSFTRLLRTFAIAPYSFYSLQFTQSGNNHFGSYGTAVYTLA